MLYLLLDMNFKINTLEAAKQKPMPSIDTIVYAL